MDHGLHKIKDPKIIEQCANFFMSHGHYDKAVNMCIINNQREKALELCFRHNVKLTENFVEKLTPKKTRNKQEQKVRKKVSIF